MNSHNLHHCHQSHNDCTDKKHINEDKDSKEILSALLVHWISHNKSHQESYLEWADKAVVMQKKSTAEFISQAVTCMEEANKMLQEAVNNL